MTELGRAAAWSIRREQLIAALGVLCAGPSPRGHERATAERLARWAGGAWPEFDWVVDEVGSDGANLESCSSFGAPAPELVLYSHLDTSLSGDPIFDAAITGLPDPAAALHVDDSRVSGFGLGVARAPAAAALAGYAAAAVTLTSAQISHRLRLLLASSGTHRSPWVNGWHTGETGVVHYLATHARPAAVIVAKSGPPGVLYEEPGAMYLRVSLRTIFGPVLARQTLRPPGGVLIHLGVLLKVLEDWRESHLRARAGTPGQTGAEVGIGCLASGLPVKPDLVPGAVEVYLYVVTIPGDDADQIAASLREHLARTLRRTPLADVVATVDSYAAAAAAATATDASIVALAQAAWHTTMGPPPPSPISSWKGSTDGVVFRAAGIDVARVGPTPRVDDQDPRIDVFDIAELLRFAGLYADVAVRHALAG